MNPVIMMWATPRSRGTAFERMMAERRDFRILHEPFNFYFYKSCDRISQRVVHEAALPGYHYSAILQDILNQADQSPVFIKDLAYYIAHVADASFLKNFKNVFFIRDPKYSLPSFFSRWPDFSLVEAGYAELFKLYEIVRETNDEAPFIIDSDDLMHHPKRVVQAFCEAVDIPFIESALQWKEGDNTDWDRWNDAEVEWHAKLKKSTGFQKTENKDYLAIEKHPRLLTAYEYCLPFYEKLHQQRYIPV